MFNLQYGVPVFQTFMMWLPSFTALLLFGCINI
jgi:hypothetical protein